MATTNKKTSAPVIPATEPGSSQNVSEEEIAKFDAIADDWWNPDGKFKPLHDLNPIRFDFVQTHAAVSLDKAKGADIGCGGGILTEALAKAGASMTGLDLSHESLMVARKHAKANSLNIDYVEQPVEQFAVNHTGEYDIITCLEMLEHVPDPQEIVDACSQLVKPGGDVFFSTLNRNPKSYLLAIIGAEYMLNLIPRGTHDYGKFIRPSELNTMLDDAGLTLKGMQGITYNPVTQIYKLSDDVSVNYIVHCRKENE